MKKPLPLILLLSLFVLTCKKNDLTPDGKPKSDAANSIIRVDSKAGATYSLVIYESNPADMSLPPVVSYINNSLNAPNEYMFKGVVGYQMLVEVDSPNGTSANCDIYFKGLKVPHAVMGVDSLDGEMPSHINLTYTIGSTAIQPR